LLYRAKAPLRISFAGGGTDVPPFPQQEGGVVLSATIGRYAYGTLQPRSDGEIHIESLDFGESVTFSRDDRLVYDGKLDLVKAAILHLGRPETGFDLSLHSDAPPGSGLGSSSAVIVSLVGLLKEWKSLLLTDYEIAEMACRIERNELGIQGGLQDQFASAFGGFNYIEFEGDQVVVNPLRIPLDVQNELQYNLLLVFTGRIRLSGRIIEDQVARFEAGETESIEALREIKRLTREMKAHLLRNELDDFGALLHEEWRQKKRMSSRISTPELDAVYDAARTAGAIGGKITGAGGGGYMLLYCPGGTRHKVARKLADMGCTMSDFAFEPLGLQTWRVG
jgi:D-glycero-alpha-D-manno-heptose-7-phosphate kinase